MSFAPSLSFTLASEAEFNELAAGKIVGRPYSWSPGSAFHRLPQGDVGVLWREPKSYGWPVRPLMIVVAKADQRRLFSRFAQVRSDLSPLSAWTHVVTPERFGRIHELVTECDLNGLETAWAGLIIAETSILADRPVPSLKLAACLATQSFALGRTVSLWGATSTIELLESYDLLQRSIRKSDARFVQIRQALAPIWATLAAAGGAKSNLSGEDEILVEAVGALAHARRHEMPSAQVLRQVFFDLPEGALLETLDITSPEDRLRQFDLIIRLLLDMPGEQSPRRRKLAFLAGYLATIAAGGAASLSLTNAVSKLLPDVMAWAYVVGGLGELVSWTSGFDGLGRLITRELMRPFNVVEPPSCDFAADEAFVLVDKQLSDPLVHLRLKQSRIATIALFPGVNLAVPFAEQPEGPRQNVRVYATQSPPPDSAWATVADAIFPHILKRLREDGANSSEGLEGSSRGIRSSRKGNQRKLL